jgi:RNA polymerase-binding transcription factor
MSAVMAPGMLRCTKGGRNDLHSSRHRRRIGRERRDDIRRLLVERRRELLNAIQSRVRDVREEGSAKYHYPSHPAETIEAEPDDDLPFALIQMKAEVLQRVNEAVRHFDEGTYGYCVDCGEVIALSRLRAMPFAVRCRDCEETREDGEHRERVQLRRLPSGLGSRLTG